LATIHIIIIIDTWQNARGAPTMVRMVLLSLGVGLFCIVSATNDPLKQLHAVVDTMQDLLITVQKEEQQEKENFDCFLEWCTKEKGEKAKEIEEQNLLIEDLKVNIDQAELEIAKNTYIIQENLKNIRDLNASIQSAQGIRAEELVDYENERALNTQSVQQLATAIKIVKGPMYGTDFLQSKQKESADPGDTSFVVGVFESLKQNMERNQVSADKEEERRKQLFNKLMAEKQKLLRNLSEESKSKQILLAETQQKLVQAQNELKSTGSGRKEGQIYLHETEKSCDMREKTWRARQADRAKEKIAIQEAIAFLKISFQEESSLQSAEEEDPTETMDAVVDAVDGDAPLSFLQSSPIKNAQRPSFLNLASLDLESANKMMSLSSLSSQVDAFVKSDRFGGIKNKIVDLISALEREQEGDLKKKKRCEAMETEQKSVFEAKQDDMTLITAVIDRKSELIQSATGGIHEIKDLMLEAKKENEDLGKQRKKEHAVFEQGLKERKLAIKVLKQAEHVLAQFYNSKEKAALIAKKKSTKKKDDSINGDPPSGRHETDSKVVLAMLEKIRNDLLRENEEAQKAEQEAERNAVKQERNAVKEFDIRMEKITEMSSQRAKSSVQLDNTKEDFEQLKDKIGAIEGKIRALTNECGEFLHSYDEREKARGFEISQLRDAHGIFSGASEAVRTGIN